MAIIRAKHSQNFTIVSNAIFNDENLDFEDIGLLVSLIGKPENWKVLVSALQNRSKHGRDWFYSRINNLISAGYMKRVESRSEDGSFSGVDYMVFDTKQEASPVTDNTEADTPDTDLPLTGYPITAQPTLISNKDKKEIINNKKYALSGNASFERFWKELRAAYKLVGSNVVGKKNTEAQFKRAVKTEALEEKLISALKAQARYKLKLRESDGFAPNFPNPERWVRDARWEDEVPEQKQRSDQDDIFRGAV